MTRRFWPQFVLLGLAAAANCAASERVLVLGGTGRLGAYTVKELVRHGHEVAVFARATSNRDRLKGIANLRFVNGDLGKSADIANAIETGRYTVIIDASGRRTADQSYSHAVAMPQIVRSARARGGVRQIVFVSSVGAGDNVKRFPQFQWGEYLPLLEERGAAEKSLIGSGVPYTIIRTGNVPQVDEPATGTARLTEDETVFGPARRPDLAALMVACITGPKCINKVFHATDDSLKMPEIGQ